VGQRHLVLADEPTGALDSVNSEGVMRLLRDVCRRGAAGVVVTHEAHLASWADRVVFLRDGRLVDQTGSAPGPETLLVAGHEVARLSRNDRARLRRRSIGFVFQDFNLLAGLTAVENVALPLELDGVRVKAARAAAMEVLAKLGLTEQATRFPDELSGGQSQRVAIARAIVKRPPIVLADEPTANLDAENSRNVLDTMAALSRDLQTTFIFATHDEKVIQYLRRRIILNDGVVVADENIRAARASEAAL
jgi:putative ABC transport system ATP-binding protein